MLALLALMPFALISCGSDDDDDNPFHQTQSKSMVRVTKLTRMLFKREVSMRKMVKANLVLVYSTKLVTLKTVGFINSLTRIQKSQR